ncbi:MAG TPA: glycosyltransferase family 1 protein [Planctomycetota bacterium]|nr:glycosyltransferase family 1 protein [Planctomycetota bacterium]
MRIGIDVSMTADSKTGLPSYTRSLVEAMARVDQHNEYWLYPITWHSFPPNHDEAVLPDARNFRAVCGRWPRRWLERAWQRGDRKRLLGPPPDVYFSPFHNAPDRWLPRLVCVWHDVSFRVHPEFSTEANRVYCEQQFDRTARLAHRVVTVSHFSRDEIVRAMGMARERIDVVHEAADPLFRHVPGTAVPARFRPQLGDRPFVLYVGSVEPRKNLATLVDAFAAVKRRSRHPASLAIAGGSGWKNSAVHEAVDRHGLRDQVHLLGFVSDDELLALYNTCAVFCYPTLYEGFGLPVIEAMSCGAPVITSRVASLPEVGGGAVAYVDEPRDAAALATTLQQVLEDRELRERLRRDGLAQAARFSWDRAARETLAILGRVAGDAGLDPTGVRMGEDERGIEGGFHDVERPSEGAFRWMQRRGSLRLRAATGAALRIVAASPLPEDEVTLIARVAGAVVGTGLLGHGPRAFRFALPEPVPRDRLLPIELEVNHTLPAAMKGGDTRDLGARVFAVEIV